jgi:hypothetical protein
LTTRTRSVRSIVPAHIESCEEPAMNDIASDPLVSGFAQSTAFAGSRPLSGEELRAAFRAAIRTLDTAPTPVLTDGSPDLEATMDALMDALVERLQEQQIVFSVVQPLD